MSSFPAPITMLRSPSPVPTAGGYSSARFLPFSKTVTRSGSATMPSFARDGLSLRRNSRGVVVLLAGVVRTEAFWEEPDVGYGGETGESDEEEDLEDNEEVEGSTANMGGGSISSAESSRDMEIPAGIELLLSAEEREILQKNETFDLKKISTKKWNPIHTLALSGQIPTMDMLLKDGVHIDVIDKDGYTALHKAVIGKKEDVISHLLRKGADPHSKDRDGATPLHYAVQVGAMQTVKLLIKYKVDVNVADNDGWTPLHVAMQCRSRDIAKVLLINGADKTRRNKNGKTPLDMSLCYGRDFKSYELAKLLKLVPADRNL